MSFTTAQRWFFDTNGYIVIPDVLTADEVAELNDVMEALPPGDGSHVSLSGALATHACMRALMNHATVDGLMTEILGMGYRLDHLYGIRMTPGDERSLELHGGATPFDPSCMYHVHNERIRCGLVVVSFQLTDCLSQGGFCCIPGTHKSNFALPADVRSQGVEGPLIVNPPAPAGSVLLFTEALVHGTQTWRGTSERRSLLYKYAPAHMCWGLASWASPEIVAALNDEQRRLVDAPGIYPRMQSGVFGPQYTRA